MATGIRTVKATSRHAWIKTHRLHNKNAFAHLHKRAARWWRESKRTACAVYIFALALKSQSSRFFSLSFCEKAFSKARARDNSKEREGAPQAHIHTHRELLLHVKLREIFSFDKVKVLSLSLAEAGLAFPFAHVVCQHSQPHRFIKRRAWRRKCECQRCGRILPQSAPTNQTNPFSQPASAPPLMYLLLLFGFRTTLYLLCSLTLGSFFRPLGLPGLGRFECRIAGCVSREIDVSSLGYCCFPGSPRWPLGKMSTSLKRNICCHVHFIDLSWWARRSLLSRRTERAAKLYTRVCCAHWILLPRNHTTWESSISILQMTIHDTLKWKLLSFLDYKITFCSELTCISWFLLSFWHFYS